MTSHAHEDWNRLVVVATLGTHRSGADRTRHRGELGTFCARVVRPTPEELLLVDVAAASLWRTCGAKPRRASSAVQAPAPAEDLTVASVLAGELLVRALEDARAELAREWCRLAAASGFRVPDELVPLLIERLESHPATRLEDADDVVRSALGARGEWFRSLHGGTSSSAPVLDPGAAFEVAAGTERRDALRHWRRSAPAQARLALEACLAECGADERATLVAELEHGLSQEDEAFLAACAGDRAKAVRLAATELLARIDGSALASRMRRRLVELVQYKPARLLRSASLTILAPDAEAPDLLQDGIEARARGLLGAKASALLEIVGRTRISTWTRELGIPADELCGLLETSEWRSALLAGLCESAIRCADSEWSRRLLEAGVPYDEALLRDVPESRGYPERLSARVERTAREALLSSLSAQGRLPHAGAWLQLAGPDWSLATSRAFLDWIARAHPRAPGDAHPLLDGHALRQVAVCIDPSVVDAVPAALEGLLRDASPAMKNQVDAFVDTLTLRHRTRKELQREQTSH